MIVRYLSAAAARAKHVAFPAATAFLVLSLLLTTENRSRRRRPKVFDDDDGDTRGDTVAGGCIVTINARYLMNSGGFQVGHWGMVLAKIIGGVDHLRLHHLSVQVFFVDDEMNPFQFKKMESTLSTSVYMKTTMRIVAEMTNTSFGIVLGSPAGRKRCHRDRLLVVDAMHQPFDDSWYGLSASNGVDAVAITMRSCSQEPIDDVLIYNRKVSRRIVNDLTLANYLRSKGLSTRIVFPDHLTPAEQICEMTRRRKMIITPHGGQMGSLVFKRRGVTVVEVSPEKALLDGVGCYRYFGKVSDPWFAIRGARAWACDAGICAKSADAWYDPDCDRKCEAAARANSINISTQAIAKVLNLLSTRSTSAKERQHMGDDPRLRTPHTRQRS